jgi:hypothetical protein
VDWTVWIVKGSGRKSISHAADHTRRFYQLDRAYHVVRSGRFTFRLGFLLFRVTTLALTRLVTFLLLDRLVLGPQSPLQQVPISDPYRRKIRRSFATNIRRVEHGFFSDSPERQ